MPSWSSMVPMDRMEIVKPRWGFAWQKLCAILLLLAAGNVPISSAAERPSPLRIAGYLPDYRLEQVDSAQWDGLTDLILFSAQPTAAGELDLGTLKAAPWSKLLTWKTAHRKRLILAVGGWDRSGGFAPMAKDDLLRGKFVAAAVELCLQRRLDGMDLDWEHPQDAAEQTSYSRLIQDLKRAFEPHGLTLSVTMAGWQKLPPDALEAADWIQIMAYDHDGRHSTVVGATRDLELVLAQKAAAGKVILGLPFYGRKIADRNQAITYGEVRKKYHPAPHIDEVEGWYFNGPTTIRQKIALVRERKLAGVMIWELGQDAAGQESLLKVIADEAAAARR